MCVLMLLFIANHSEQVHWRLNYNKWQRASRTMATQSLSVSIHIFYEFIFRLCACVLWSAVAYCSTGWRKETITLRMNYFQLKHRNFKGIVPTIRWNEFWMLKYFKFVCRYSRRGSSPKLHSNCYIILRFYEKKSFRRKKLSVNCNRIGGIRWYGFLRTSLVAN